MPSVSRKGKGKAELKTEAQLPLGKQLAHTDKVVRDQAVANLSAFLSRGGVSEDGDDDMEAGSSGYVRLSDSEMAKLWKGLFYCFWMSDKPLVQQALATDLANFLLRINPRSENVADRNAARLDAALAFLEGFWIALVREWNGIDRLRIDKYYMLIRRYVNATFRLLARSDWSEEAVAAVNNILTAKTGPLSWQDRSVPSSLATHLSDVYLEELDKVLALPDAESQRAVPLMAVLSPFTQLLARTPNQHVHTRVMKVVFTPALVAFQSPEDDEDERPAKRSRATQEFENIAMGSCTGLEGKPVADLSASVRAAILKAMFKEAAQESTVESNRRKIYKVVREESGDDDDDDE